MSKINHRKLKRRQKIGQTLPVDNISIEELKDIFDNGCGCYNPYIIKQPLGYIQSLPRFYDEFCYKCLSCEWISVSFRTRTQ